MSGATLTDENDPHAMWMLLQHYKSIGDHAKAGYWANRLNIFPEFDFIEIPVEDN